MTEFFLDLLVGLFAESYSGLYCGQYRYLSASGRESRARCSHDRLHQQAPRGAGETGTRSLLRSRVAGWGSGPICAPHVRRLVCGSGVAVNDFPASLGFSKALDPGRMGTRILRILS